MKYQSNKSSRHSTFIFIDRAVEDYQQLIAGKIPGTKVFLLHDKANGLEQISNILREHSHVSSVHLVSHGKSGELNLGNGIITAADLITHSLAIGSWFKGDSGDRELVVYGCGIAEGKNGQQFLRILQTITQAQIYASTDIVGNRDRGGTWSLPRQLDDFQKNRNNHKTIATLPFNDATISTYHGVFATGTDGAYTYYDSNEANRAVAFNDISTSGTNIRDGDNQQAEWQENVNLPFSFNFYGTSYNSITISDNGGIIFGVAATQVPLTNGSIPRANPSFSIFPFWDDLRSNTVYTATVGNSFIVQWEESTHGDLDSQNIGDPVTFQAVLTSGSNGIDFVYQDINFGNVAYDNGASATIGINKSSASNLGIEYSQDQAIAATSISFVSEPVLNKAFLEIDEEATVTLTSTNFNATDVDNGSTPENIIFLVTNVQNGNFQVGGNNVSQFTQAQINSSAVTFVHDGDEDAPSFSVQITDGVNSSAVKSITTTSPEDDFKVVFTNINDAPVNTAPTAIATDEDIPFAFTGGNSLSVSDADVSAGSNQLQVTLAVNSGALTLGTVTNLTPTGNGTASVSITGTPTDVNNALASLSYLGSQDFNGNDTLTMTTLDLGNSGSGGQQQDVDTIAITVNAINDAPVNTIPASYTTDEDTALQFTGVSVADVDVGTDDLLINLAVTNGAIALASSTGLSFTDDDGSDGTLSFTGTLTNVNAALTGITFTPTENLNSINQPQATTFTLTTNDQDNNGAGGALVDTDVATITINAVNDAPVNTAPSTITVDEDSSVAFDGANTISVSDIDVGETPTDGSSEKGKLKVTLAVTKGVVNLSTVTGLSFENTTTNNTASFTVTGTLADLNTALATLTYAPNANYNGPDTLTITTEDQGNTGTGGNLIDTDQVAITVNPVNDAPINTVPGAQTANEDIDLVFSTANGNAISIDDVDVNNASLNREVNQAPFTDQQNVTLTVTNGTLTLGSVANLSSVTNNGTAQVTLVGAIADINNALNGLAYRGNSNFNGDDTLTILTNDLGNTGTSAALSDSDTIAISIEPINDAPTVTVPSTQTVSGTSITLSSANGNGVTIGDIDIDPTLNNKPFVDGQVVTASIGSGTLTANMGGTGTVTNNGTGSVSIAGTVAEVNTALDGLEFDFQQSLTGNIQLNIVSNDQQNTGINNVALEGNQSLTITIPDSDGDGINNPYEDKVATELSQSLVSNNFGTVALYLDGNGTTVPSWFRVASDSQSALGGTVDNPAIGFTNTKAEAITNTISDPKAAFNPNDPKAANLSSLEATLDVLSFDVIPGPGQDISNQLIAVEIKLPETKTIDTFTLVQGSIISDFRREENPDRATANFASLTGVVLQDRDLDGTAEWAIAYLQDGGWGDTDGAVNGQISTALLATDWEFGSSSLQASDQGLTFNGDRGLVNFALSSYAGETASEVGFARVVLDSSGTITSVNGVGVNSLDETKTAILNQGEVLFSTLSNGENPVIAQQQRTIALDQSETAVFFVINDGTQEELLTNGLTSKTVAFSIASLNQNNTNVFSSSGSGDQATISFADLLTIDSKILSAQEVATQRSVFAINGEQGRAIDEIIDLSTSGAFDGKTVALSLKLDREADFNNSVYLYRVDDSNGSIIDPLTGATLNPLNGLSSSERSTYLNLMVNDRLVNGSELRVGDLATSTVELSVAGGEFYLPFMVSNGVISNVNSNFSNVLTSFMAVNSDGVDHIRTLGSGVFGFEDTIGGGDRDFNDMILTVDQIAIA